MKWLTQKEIKAAAEKSKKAAIACSVLHWEQVLTATKEELLDFLVKKSESLIRWQYCALCVRCKNNCKPCPMPSEKVCRRSGSVWVRASRAFVALQNGNIGIKAFRTRTQPMLDLLRSL